MSNREFKLIPIYRLEVITDWYGGKLQDRYFYSQDSAIESLRSSSGFHFDEVSNKWFIDNAKEVKVARKNNIMSISGTPVDSYIFNLREPKEFAIASITMLYVSGNIVDDKLYVLRKCNKKELHKNIMQSIGTNNNPDEFIINQDYYFKDSEFLSASFSKSYIKKVARLRYKGLARLWNYEEFKKRIYEFIEHPDSFNDKDIYMSIKEFYVN